MNSSPIWDSAIRDSVTLSKAPDAEVNRRRSQFLIPGITELPLDGQESRIPVMLIQRPGLAKKTSRAEKGEVWAETGFGAGWDLIVPAGWGEDWQN